MRDVQGFALGTFRSFGIQVSRAYHGVMGFGVCREFRLVFDLFYEVLSGAQAGPQRLFPVLL